MIVYFKEFEISDKKYLYVSIYHFRTKKSALKEKIRLFFQVELF